MSKELDDIRFLLWDSYRRHGRTIRLAAVVVVLVWIGSTVFYQVAAESEGVVLRLGAYSKTTGPGLHSKLPWPIDTVHVVPVRLIQSLEFGFATIQAGRVTEYAPTSREQATISRMLTGDLNLAHVEWIVQYRIKDPRDYLFQIGGDPVSRVAVEDTIRNVSESVMRQLVGDSSVDEVITIQRDQIASDAKVKIQEMLDAFESGVAVVTVKLQAVTPPEEVKDAFDEVNRARQNKERIVNEALGERNKRIPAARGQRDRAISEAEGYRERVTRIATGKAKAFLAQLAEYEKAPEVTRSRLYLETMESVLGQVESKTVIDESIRGLMPLLNLDAGAAGSGAAPRGPNRASGKGGGS